MAGCCEELRRGDRRANSEDSGLLLLSLADGLVSSVRRRSQFHGLEHDRDSWSALRRRKEPRSAASSKEVLCPHVTAQLRSNRSFQKELT